MAQWCVVRHIERLMCHISQDTHSHWYRFEADFLNQNSHDACVPAHRNQAHGTSNFQIICFRRWQLFLFTMFYCTTEFDLKKEHGARLLHSFKVTWTLSASLCLPLPPLFRNRTANTEHDRTPLFDTFAPHSFYQPHTDGASCEQIVCASVRYAMRHVLGEWK